MSYLREQFSYLRGLADGMDLDFETKEGKLLAGIINLLDEVTLTVEELDEEIGEIDEFVEAIDEDLADLEDDFYEELDMFDGDYEVVCPECGELIIVDGEIFEEGACETLLTCPACEEEFQVFDDECEVENDEE